MILGLARPEHGWILVDSERVNGDCGYRARIGYMPQIARFPENLTGAELLAMLTDLRGEGAARDEELVERFALGDQLRKPLRTLSGGTRQKVNAVMAFLFAPDLLILDEPTAGLDPAASRQLHELVRRMSRQEGRTVVLCTHYLAEAQELCDRVAVLARGRLLAVGTPAELARRIAPSLELLLEVDPAQTADALRIIATCDGMAGAPAADGVIAVTGARREEIPALAARLTGAGVRLYRLVPREPTLADAYFALQPGAGAGA
jgi:ABC-type multidrug transport system ATPase subunit